MPSSDLHSCSSPRLRFSLKLDLVTAIKMGAVKRPTDVSSDLAVLKHNEKQNKELPKLPANVTVARRPINHAPIASPFAGSKIPKIVYVSRKTPVMSAVKRVKKFLREIEKRALQSEDMSSIFDRAGNPISRGQAKDIHRRLEDVSEKLRRDAEEVLVKASGRAMEQALRIAEWFRNKEKEMLTNVEVRTGSVSVVDDLVETDVAGDDEPEAKDGEEDKENLEESTMLEGGDTTMELLGLMKAADQASKQTMNAPTIAGTDQQPVEQGTDPVQASKRGRRKRKRKEYDANDIPEARLRWVKTVEIAISLRA